MFSDSTHATFDINSMENDEAVLTCSESENEDLKGCEIKTVPEGIRAMKTTLKSHPGKALVNKVMEKPFKHAGHEVRYYGIGDEKDACLFYFCGRNWGNHHDQGEIVRLSVDYNHALDCCRGHYTEDTIVVSWLAHTGGN